jgi:hypothetical protein
MAAVKIEPALSHLLDSTAPASDTPAGDGEWWTPELRSVALRLMQRAQRRPENPDDEKPDTAIENLAARLGAEVEQARGQLSPSVRLC